MTTPASPPRPGPSLGASVPPSVAAARTLVADLVRQGVRDVVLSPGSRSAPLAYALAEAADAGRLTLHVRVDERSAGFLALGLARGTPSPSTGAGPAGDPLATPTTWSAQQGRGVPVAVVTTSGTAVANLHPAVLEAHHAGVPLVVISADRPHELRGTGASQTTDQVGIFGSAVRFAADVPAPDGRDGELRDLVAVSGRALAAALGLRDVRPGPVHLNLGFRDPLHPSAPLESLSGDEAWSRQGRPTGPGGDGDEPPGGDAWPEGSRRTVVVPPARGPGADPVLPGRAACTLVVAGDGAGPEARTVAEAQGWPLLAEPSSGACGGPNAIAGYRLVLGVDELTRDVEQVVVFGRPTLSRPVQRLLARPDVAVTVVAPGGGPWPDAVRNAAAVVPALGERWSAPPTEPTEPTEPTGRPGPGDGSFVARWRAAGAAAADVLATASGDAAVGGGLPAAPHGALAVARAVAGVLGPNDVLVVGSSNPVRDLELVLGLDHPQSGDLPDVVANRGLAGIDGTVSTALGVAHAAARQGRRTRALVGDLTFLHDVGGLLRGPQEPGVDLEIVVVNDDGGSIFATLEHGALAASSPGAAATFERVFGTPHGANLAQLCAGYGVDHQLVLDVGSLRHALRAPTRGIQVIEVRVPRTDRLAGAQDLARAVAEAVGRAL
ncbi:2-succinyl-5-enolpyruvyl-6-hydroxy-3-cyclohexene-1-carboxylic-acid synthase [Isoptericola sp. NEAU-Y5]|uniref:2-succinyl-5-enolpyruvyl-6-hydroxy-3-cyclohexene-1-carboxylate synthase n=1 Tax=Isoptericola luteus TaxID=2879484 RepID=A0ABS7ZKK7_9MICO|nr:2-succinyl-5-enolpyruvyl-6-hydroxy-3-cyclohexene-1-carboxylic-acid synthase [Isoptericola sp. NEAU-Y5]MCA5895032.1 2-succinyl-5-enolpyruvyl-6-hydroxy-3-cyclohexene-1-carboxylic-acid synthase [Isoptericola sp. NEAU-Y5]